MNPNFKIETKNGDLTEQIRSRLERLTIRDEASYNSDTMTLELVDDGIEWPKEGTEFTVSLGYENVLTTVGKFTFKHVRYSSKGKQTLTITAAAMEHAASLKSQREQSWDATTLGAIAEEIARRNSLKPQVFDELKAIPIEHEDQTESDIAFLCRLGRRYDLTVKVSGRYLMLAPADKSGDPDGTNKPILIRNPTGVDYSGDQTQRYTGVRAFWYDNEAAEKKHVLYGKEGVVLELEYNKITEAGARKAAETKFREVVRKGETLSFTVPGNLQLAAERKADVQGIRPAIDGIWVIKTVEHVYAPGGFESSVECSVDGYKEVKKADEASDDSEAPGDA
jgi:uncharacterized protein